MPGRRGPRLSPARRGRKADTSIPLSCSQIIRRRSSYDFLELRLPCNKLFPLQRGKWGRGGEASCKGCSVCFTGCKFFSSPPSPRHKADEAAPAGGSRTRHRPGGEADPKHRQRHVPAWTREPRPACGHRRTGAAASVSPRQAQGCSSDAAEMVISHLVATNLLPKAPLWLPGCPGGKDLAETPQGSDGSPGKAMPSAGPAPADNVLANSTRSWDSCN